MIDVALGTKNRMECFKKAIFNLNNLSNSNELCLFIMDGNEHNQVQDFLSSRKWNFNSFNIWRDNGVEVVRNNPGKLVVIYNFLFKQGSSPYLTYWSDDILVNDRGAFRKAVKRMEECGRRAGSSVFLFLYKDRYQYPFLLTSEIGVILINFGIIKREAFEKVGGLDETFNFFCSDRDLTNKIYMQGYKTIINGDVVVSHIKFDDEWRNPLSLKDSFDYDQDRALRKWSSIIVPRGVVRDYSIGALYLDNSIIVEEEIAKKLSFRKIFDYECHIFFRADLSGKISSGISSFFPNFLKMIIGF